MLTVSCEEPVAEVEATNPIRPDDDDPDKGAKTDLHHPLDANFLYPYDATRHPDGYKSTDFENGNSNRAEKAYLLRIGHSANVALEYAGDRDFLAVELTEGRRYRFTSRPTSVSGLQGVSRSVIELLSNDRMMGDSCKLARDGDGEDLNYVVAARGRPNPRVTEQVDLESNYSAFEFTAYRTGCFFVGIKGEGAPSAGGVRVTLSNR